MSKGNGLEAWRSFFAEWEPAHQNRFGNLLLQILNTKFKGESLKELEAWETQIREYEGSTLDRIANNIRQATYQNGLPENSVLLQHLQLNSDRYEKYADLKGVIENYHRSKKAWTTQGTPMDVDALQKGRGKKTKEEKDKQNADKGWKGKSKGKSKGKFGKGKFSKGKGKFSKGKGKQGS